MMKKRYASEWGLLNTSFSPIVYFIIGLISYYLNFIWLLPIALLAHLIIMYLIGLYYTK